MLLVLDVGNTNTVMGIYSKGELIKHWRLTSHKQTADEVGFMINGFLNSSNIQKNDIKAAIYASVVPSLDEMFLVGVREYIGIECIRINQQSLNLGFDIKIKSPATLGADRLLNAIAGIHKYGYPLIIVDLGTAITLDVISPDGSYQGGVIAPGMELGLDSLFSKTAKLPQISLDSCPRYIGTDTTEAIQAGIVLGSVGMIDSLLRGVFKELGVEKCPVIATGGHAKILTSYSEIVKQVDPWLTLDGMKIIYEKKLYKE
ncbi:MAG: type III pantothenate kinase [Synergistaceae bacterium]